MRVETVLQLDDVGVIDHLHDLQLPVLEPLVLQDLFNGNLARGGVQLQIMVAIAQIKRAPFLTVSPVSKQVA